MSAQGSATQRQPAGETAYFFLRFFLSFFLCFLSFFLLVFLLCFLLVGLLGLLGRGAFFGAGFFGAGLAAASWRRGAFTGGGFRRGLGHGAWRAAALASCSLRPWGRCRLHRHGITLRRPLAIGSSTAIMRFSDVFHVAHRIHGLVAALVPVIADERLGLGLIDAQTVADGLFVVVRAVMQWPPQRSHWSSRRGGLVYTL